MISQLPSSVFIIEDNPVHASLIQNGLTKWAGERGIKIELFHSFDDALEKLQSPSSNALVITEYFLDQKNALDFLADLKSRNRSVPVILMASSNDREISKRALDAGFSDYLVKSEEHFNDLVHIIQTAWERHILKNEENKLRNELAQKNADLSIMSQYLSELSVRDELTGVYNHRFLQEKISEEFARVLRYRYPLSCLMVDLDHFKLINDTYGHPVGDQLLKELSQMILNEVRETDTVARYGGEEFVILLPHVGYEGAMILAERLIKEVANTIFLPATHSFHVTVSIGISSFPEDPLERRDSLITFSDRALYRAKGSGRNRICLYREMAKEFADQLPELKISSDRVIEFRRRLSDISELAKQAYIEATKALINALEAKDAFTLGHAERVAQYAVITAKQMRLSDDDIKIIEHAGLLHDIGKICIADEILLKKGPLTKEEYEQMKTHTLSGYQIVRPIKFLAEEALIILHHHEWFNGHGYPDHLKGREIPAGARIVSIADAYDTMRQSGGRYKQTIDAATAANEVIHCAGTQFDPEIAVRFIAALVEKGEIDAKDYDVAKLEAALKPPEA